MNTVNERVFVCAQMRCGIEGRAAVAMKRIRQGGIMSAVHICGRVFVLKDRLGAQLIMAIRIKGCHATSVWIKNIYSHTSDSVSVLDVV